MDASMAAWKAFLKAVVMENSMAEMMVAKKEISTDGC